MPIIQPLLLISDLIIFDYLFISLDNKISIRPTSKTREVTLDQPRCSRYSYKQRSKPAAGLVIKRLLPASTTQRMLLNRKILIRHGHYDVSLGASPTLPFGSGGYPVPYSLEAFGSHSRLTVLSSMSLRLPYSC